MAAVAAGCLDPADMAADLVRLAVAPVLGVERG